MSSTIGSNDFSANHIDTAIIMLADENGLIKFPSSTIAQHLRIPEIQVSNRIKFLKSQKMVTTKSGANGSKYTQLVVNIGFMKQAYNENRRIWILVDLENINKAELTSSDRVSYSKLKNHALKFGKVFQAEIYLPHHYLNPNREREINYYNQYDWKVVICGRVKKDKDLVDHRIKREVGDISHYFPDDEIWIISRDSDFMEDVVKNKYRGKNNIKLIDPFTIPDVLGYEEREIKSALSRPVLNILESIKALTNNVMESETDEQRLIRYSAGWLLSQPTETIEFNNHKACVYELGEFLNKKIAKRLKMFPDFPKHALTALREIGMICEMENGRQSYQLLINRDHEIFPIVAPPRFIYQTMNGQREHA